MAMNRGEWSEFYAILSMLVSPELEIGNEKLESITKQLYSVKKLSIEEQNTVIDYVLTNNSGIEIYFDNVIQKLISNSELLVSKDAIYNEICLAQTGAGAFEIRTVQPLLNKMTTSGILKSKSMSKSDLKATLFDIRLGDNVALKYSIKSSLGSPATILNSSSHTNFIYEIENISLDDINKINSIKTNTKLVDRIKEIKKLNGIIKFDKVECENFEYNLKLIDSKMPEYLGNILLDSYSSQNKNLKELFLKAGEFKDQTFALKKLGDFLEGISFGFVPSFKWNGINDVNGGLVVVKKDGKTIILDLIYFKQTVINYLINETKLDSPSSTRYHMLELYVENGKIYFKLNLQIRYKK